MIPRALGAMADGLDEHMCLVRLADKEQVDLVELQSGLHRFMASIQTWGFISKGIMNQHGFYFTCTNYLLLMTYYLLRNPHCHPWFCFERAGPRFIETIEFLFAEGRCWKLNGTYAALCLPLGSAYEPNAPLSPCRTIDRNHLYQFQSN